MSHASLASRSRAGQAGQPSLLTASSGSEVLGAEGLREGGSRQSARWAWGAARSAPLRRLSLSTYVEEARRSSKSWYRHRAAPLREIQRLHCCMVANGLCRGASRPSICSGFTGFAGLAGGLLKHGVVSRLHIKATLLQRASRLSATRPYAAHLAIHCCLMSISAGTLGPITTLIRPIHGVAWLDSESLSPSDICAHSWLPVLPISSPLPSDDATGSGTVLCLSWPGSALAHGVGSGVRALADYNQSMRSEEARNYHTQLRPEQDNHGLIPSLRLVLHCPVSAHAEVRGPGFQRVERGGA